MQIVIDIPDERSLRAWDKKPLLAEAERLIADDSFVYMGDSLQIIEIVNAIKDGYRLVKED